MAGYNQDILKEYVPALVYTMYDGYYIYSPYTNTLDSTNSNKVIINETTGETGTKSDAEILNSGNDDATYKEGDKISGLKPYIYYSCRYVKDGIDVTITYTLDNYITIQGTINGQGVYDYGYLLDNIEESGSNVFYRGKCINNETTTEDVYDPDTGGIETYQYIKVNGVKYYKDNTNDKWFSILNGTKYWQGQFSNTDSAAINYYKEAYDFKGRVKGYGLDNLKGSDAVDENGEKLVELDENGNKTDTPKLGNYTIFDFNNGSGSKSIEDPNSNFNQQRLAVIRYSIEKNLSIAIANYNNYSGVTTDFQMPELKEDEWDKIINNVSIISFLQGLSIGGKIYNGYSIINNNKNQEVVNEDSIYIVTENINDNTTTYHRANDKDLLDNTYTSENIIKTGVLNIDFERKSNINSSGQTIYFYPQKSLGCYTSIVSQTNVEATDNMYEYIANKGGTLAQVYFTALGRERYGMYKTNNDSNKIKEKFGYTP